MGDATMLYHAGVMESFNAPNDVTKPYYLSNTNFTKKNNLISLLTLSIEKSEVE